MDQLQTISIMFIIWGIVFLLEANRKRELRKQINLFQKNNISKIIYQKNNITCEVNTIGTKRSAYRFNSCDLMFCQDCLAVVGFLKIGNFRTLANFLVFKNGTVNDSNKIKKLNLNSFHNDVYIEFGELPFRQVNVEIRLKNLSDEEKEKINILNSA